MKKTLMLFVLAFALMLAGCSTEGKIGEIGDTLKLNGLNITLNDHRITFGDFMDPDYDFFLVLDLTIENTTKKPEQISTLLQMEVHDAEGYIYDVDYFTDTIGDLDVNIGAGKKVRGEVAFDVPVASYYNFVFSNPFTKGEVIWRITDEEILIGLDEEDSNYHDDSIEDSSSISEDREEVADQNSEKHNATNPDSQQEATKTPPNTQENEVNNEEEVKSPVTANEPSPNANLKGIELGMTKKEIESLLGTPTHSEPDMSGVYDAIDTYGNLIIAYYDNEAWEVSWYLDDEVNRDLLNIDQQPIEYGSVDGTHYYLYDEVYLIIARPNRTPSKWKTEVKLTVIDDNFMAGIEFGDIWEYYDNPSSVKADEYSN